MGRRGSSWREIRRWCPSLYFGGSQTFGTIGHYVLKDGSGNDTLERGTGRDLSNGGTGFDHFVFKLDDLMEVEQSEPFSKLNLSTLDYIEDF